MKTRIPHLALALLLGSAAGASAAEVKLTGIACLHFGKVALVEITPARPGGPLRYILRVGDRVEGVELKSIDEKAARVTIIDGERTVELSLDGQEGVANQTFNLKDADSSQVLDVYQDTTGRTVLRSPGLVGSRIDLKTGAGLTPVDAEAALAGALREKGTVVAMRYDKFAFAVPFSYVPRLASIQPPPESPKPDDKTEGFPPGLIKFVEADKFQVLEIYQELSGRTLLHSPDLPGAKVTVRTQTPLTRGEGLWVLETMLRLGGITLMTEGKFVFVVRTIRETNVPPFSAPPAPTKPDDTAETFPPGLIKFTDADPSQVMEVYQELAGRTLLYSPALPRSKVRVRSQTPLSRAEAIWLLEASLRLGGITLVTEDKFVFVLPTARGTAPAVSSNAALAARRNETFPPSAIKFADTTSDQVLQAYAKLIGREAVSKDVPGCRFTLKSQTPLTSGEAIYALDAAAALNHVQFVVNEKEVRLIPVGRLPKDAAP